MFNEENSIVTLLEFLSLILNKYAVVYYQAKSIEKNRENGDHGANSRQKGLQNISKLNRINKKIRKRNTSRPSQRLK